ncbi:conserved hypothetical protein [Xanthobacter versatilis]|uniref:Uncharacterized protein n=1 Tax=Xanthobacter autotrophicus (strain ATCC BAA-1158 / Py2) TaxID=78245 RepID=A7IH51_XANP2|nr:conserved hypothetical protein [Xanthobacter autotrophicus Py2]
MTVPARPALAAAPAHEAAVAVHAVPALVLKHGFRLLVLRELAAGDGPAGFAVIEQALLRPPPRTIRHGVAFALAFRPEVVAFLTFHLGRPGTRGPDDLPLRNPHWPALSWHRAERLWSDGARSIEWSADILFAREDDCSAFARQFHSALGIEQPVG